MSTLSMKSAWQTIISFCYILSFGTTTAGIYPAQVTPQLVSPYSFKLSDHAIIQEKLFVNPLLVEGQDLNFQSMDFATGAVPTILDRGINQRLTNLGLQPYFNLSNGLNEICHFTYNADCPPPHYVFSEAKNSQTVIVNWQAGQHLRYLVQYRKKSPGENDWFGLWSQGSETTIDNLEAGTVYEFRVGGECGHLLVSPEGRDGGLVYSAIHEFTTPSEDEMAYYNCGIPPKVEIGNQDPLQYLGIYEIFTAGDFSIIVKYATNLGDGRYSGWGYVTVPYIGSTNIGVEFENIKINTDYQLVEGMVETSSDAIWDNPERMDGFFEDIGELLNSLFSQKEELLELLSKAQGFEEQQGIIDQVNNLADTIYRQIEGKEYLSRELLDELEGGGILSIEMLSPQEIESFSTADAQRRERFIEIATIAENEKFYRDASDYLLDGEPDFVIGLLLIYEFFGYLDNTYEECKEEENSLKSYKNQGLVPYCLWENPQVAPINYHGSLDSPFMAGLLDGPYQEAGGMVLLPKLLLDSHNTKYDVFYMYTASYIQCPETLQELNSQRVKELYHRMDELRPSNIFGPLFSFFDGKTDYVSDYQDPRCEDAFKLRKEVGDLLEFLKEREVIKELFASIENELADYFESISNMDTISRYEHGKLVVAALTSLVHIEATQLSKLGMLKKVLQTLKSYTRSQMDEFLPKFYKFMDEGLAKQ